MIQGNRGCFDTAFKKEQESVGRYTASGGCALRLNPNIKRRYSS